MDKKIDIKDAVWTVFQMYGADFKEMDLDSIAWYVVEGTNDYSKDDIDEVRKMVSSYLAKATSKIVKGELYIKNENVDYALNSFERIV